MAKPNEKNKIINSIKNIANSVQVSIDKIYNNTYFNSSDTYKATSVISSEINKSLDDITNHLQSDSGETSMSKVYTRLLDSQNDNEIIKNIQDTFSDEKIINDVLGMYLEDKHLEEYYNEIDSLCKYMPKLEEALETKRDNILSSDNFSKDYITIINNSDSFNDSEFYDRVSSLKEKYNLIQEISDIYDNASKYGEEYIYIVPYKKAIFKLLQNKTNIINCSVNINENSIDVVSEDGDVSSLQNLNMHKNDLVGKGIELEFSMNNIVESVIENKYNCIEKRKRIHESSLAYLNETTLDKTIDDNIEIPKFKNKDVSSDGFMNSEELKQEDINIKGCVFKKLNRSNVKPIYIEDICLGYYYFEFINKDNHITALTSYMKDPMKQQPNDNLLNNENNTQEIQALKTISGQISKLIDTKFINANQDISKEIYTMLRYNDVFNSKKSVKVSFIPPEDVVHIKFATDPKTHRGISDLEKAIVPAKLFSSLYITNTIGVMTRGQDKRVYYVKTAVDTNIAQTLQNTINQIKKSNFGIRQFSNINNVLNITGRFNDYVIPTGSGEPPINMEILAGQNIDIKTDLMSMLEEMAINSTGVPLELIQSRQSMDYAIQYTMSSSKFIRKVYSRQTILNSLLSRIITKIYNYEYDTLIKLEVKLPPPLFLNITNTDQLIQNTRNMINSITEEELQSDNIEENYKHIYKDNLLKYYLGTYLDMNMIERIREKSIMQASKIKKEEAAEESNTEDSDY